jgi:hypothetical protein
MSGRAFNKFDKIMRMSYDPALSSRCFSDPVWRMCGKRSPEGPVPLSLLVPYLTNLSLCLCLYLSISISLLSSLLLYRQIESAQLGSILKGISSPGQINKVYSSQPASHIPIDSFAQEDRERALELLLSQERVVTLLYSKVFPVTNTAANAPNTLNGNNLHRGGAGAAGGAKGGLMGPSIDELLHGVDDDDDSTAGSPTRPSTTGGLGGGGNSSTSSLRPHTLGGGEDLTGDGK